MGRASGDAARRWGAGLLAAALCAGGGLGAAAEAEVRPPGVATAVWTGPGPNACRGACPLDWAMGQLTDERRAQVEAALAEGPAQRMLVHPGDVFEFMTYQRRGEPFVDPRRTVAGITRPERAWGWRFDGWSFVQLEACGNWAPVVHAERAAVLATGEGPVLPGGAATDPGGVGGVGGVGGILGGGGGGGGDLGTSGLAGAPPVLAARLPGQGPEDPFQTEMPPVAEPPLDLSIVIEDIATPTRTEGGRGPDEPRDAAVPLPQAAVLLLSARAAGGALVGRRRPGDAAGQAGRPPAA
ncbi:MAG: hypothetical protein AAF192_09720 [Pseudomonadota bacterium]